MSRDYRDLLFELNAHAVEYLVVGAHALAAHGKVRATKALNIWVCPDQTNGRRAIEALRAFGAPLLDLTARDLNAPGTVIQIGVAPVRIDILTAIDGVDFAEAWPDRVLTRFADQQVPVLSRAHLIRNKQASNRKQDLADLEWLRQHPPENSGQ